MLEDIIFKKSIADFNKLEKYGFKKQKDNYILKRIFMNNQFEAIIKVDLSGNIIGKVYDLETNLEYTNIRLNNEGTFSSYVREEYKKILIGVAEYCFTKKQFIYNQSNRLANYIKEKYNVTPDFLWDGSPDAGVFRNKESLKWFGIIMHINKTKLDNENKDIEVINVKINVSSDDLIKNKGFYKAYHMNKKSWITIILDETLSDKEIIKYIDISYNLVNKK